MTSSVCEKCGSEVSESCWPFCPHPIMTNSPNVIDDTLTGGARYMHNLAEVPIWVETKSQLKRELASRGLAMAERKDYCKEDKSPYATRTRLRPGARDPFLSRS